MLPVRRQAIIWNNADLFLTESSGIDFSQILIKTQRSSYKKYFRKMATILLRPSWVK